MFIFEFKLVSLKMFKLDFAFISMQRKKFTDESSSLTEQITKLDQLLSSRTNILKVTLLLVEQ